MFKVVELSVPDTPEYEHQHWRVFHALPGTAGDSHHKGASSILSFLTSSDGMSVTLFSPRQFVPWHTPLYYAYMLTLTDKID